MKLGKKTRTTGEADEGGEKDDDKEKEEKDDDKEKKEEEEASKKEQLVVDILSRMNGYERRLAGMGELVKEVKEGRRRGRGRVGEGGLAVVSLE